MPERLSRFGVGPRILASAGIYAAIAGVVSHHYPKIFIISIIPYGVFMTVGIVLLLIGIPTLILSVHAAMIAYNRDRLATDGIFGIVRNPIYAAWIVVVIPGLVMFSQSWLMLLTPFVAYAAFKMLIRREDQYLAERFGQEYETYRSQVNEIIPCPRFRHR